MRGLVAVLSLVLGVTSAPVAARAVDDQAGKLVSAAIERGGGAPALRKFQNISWTGQAQVYVKGKPTTLMVDTQILPSGVVRSKSWLKDKGRASERMLEMSPNSGLITREGLTEPMPEAIFQHERVQYGLYQLLRLVPLLDKQVNVSSLPADAAGLNGVRVERPDHPDVTLWFGADHRPARIDVVVFDPASGERINESLFFSGEIVSHGVAWPRAIRITWNGKPYFDLELSGFLAQQL